METEKSDQSREFLLVVDVGSTNIKARVTNRDLKIMGKASCKVEYLYPSEAAVEIDVDWLWENFQAVLKKAVKDAGLTFKNICGLGISFQRGCCLTWDRETGEPFHNLISWKDRRATLQSKRFNEAYITKALKIGSGLMYYLSGFNRRYLLGKIIHVEPYHCSMRIQERLETLDKLRERANQGQAVFGGLDTWLLWKLTGGKLHAMDHGGASTTACFDPFLLKWSDICRIVGIPLSMFPSIIETCGHLCTVDEDIFGAPLKVTAMMADVPASLFGLCCFDKGDIACNIGTGGYLTINTGSYIHMSIAGLYPMIGWKLGKEIMYQAEGNAGCFAPATEWLIKLGFVEKADELDSMAKSVPDSGGVCFVPAYTGFQVPINDPTACTSLIGIKEETTKEHIVRAVLESFAFRFYQLYDTVQTESFVRPKPFIRACGGISNSDIVLQSIADLCECDVERPDETDMSLRGITYMAGLGGGVWKSVSELEKLRKVEKVFVPTFEGRERLLRLTKHGRKQCLDASAGLNKFLVKPMIVGAVCHSLYILYNEFEFIITEMVYSIL